MKEFELKYGCNPNQKPSKVFIENGELPFTVLCGKPGYYVTSGKVRFKGKDLLALSPEERACEGLFLSMQYPVEIPGVPVTSFLKHAVNAIRSYKGEPELDTMEFIKMVKTETDDPWIVGIQEASSLSI